MAWNWQKNDWPRFAYKKSANTDLEARFSHQSGIFLGALKHVSTEDKNTLIVDLMSTEALKTSEIEGERYEPHCSRLMRFLRHRILRAFVAQATRLLR